MPESREPNASPERVELEIAQPLIAELHYARPARSFSKQRNRIRQDGLEIERKFRTIDWSKRVGQWECALSMFGCWPESAPDLPKMKRSTTSSVLSPRK